MSVRENLLRELAAIREELHLLTIRVNRLHTQVIGAQDSDFELVGESTATSHNTSSAAGTTEGRGDSLREDAARETGRFFLRCLQGLPRGESGRSRVKLQNRIYVVVRTYSGEVHTAPVIVLERYNQVKRLVCHPDAEVFGDSIFCGFPSKWEAQLAVSTAGFSWP